jgi:hypothetical protein
MKGKQLLILLVAVAVLGGAWMALSKRDQSSWTASSAGAGGKIVDFPINDVAHVVIKAPAGELNLVKKADVWTVKERADYPASFEQVSGLIRKLWELKTVQEVKVGPSQLPRLELDEKSATVVTFEDKDDKPLGAVVVGKKHLRKSDGGEQFGGPSEGFPAGRYVKPAANARVSLVSETLDEVDPKPERWLAKDFIKVEGPKSITVTGPQQWSVSRESTSAEWKLADAKPDEKVDAGKTSSLGSNFASPSFTDVQAPDTKLEEPVTTATIETFDGFRYELKIGKPNGENYPVLVNVSAESPKERTPGKDEKPEDKERLDGEFVVKQKKLEEKLAAEKKMEGRLYLVAKYAVDPLLKDRTALLPDKPAEPAPSATTATTPPVTATTPPITVTTPPVTAPAPKIEAVTPPVQAPPPPEKKAEPEAAPPPVPAPPQPPAPQPAPPEPPQPSPPKPLPPQTPASSPPSPPPPPAVPDEAPATKP